MHTFEQAQAEALKARQSIDKLDAMKAEAETALASKRQELATYEATALDAIARLGEDLGEARRELQAALQRQNDAPIGAGFVPAIETRAEAVVTVSAEQIADLASGNDGFRVNPFTGASERFGA